VLAKTESAKICGWYIKHNIWTPIFWSALQL